MVLSYLSLYASGEVIVTMDYWHQAYNLEDSIAVTGNFIDKGASKSCVPLSIMSPCLRLVHAMQAMFHLNQTNLFGSHTMTRLLKKSWEKLLEY